MTSTVTAMAIADFGPPSVLATTEVPLPEPSSAQVRIDVVAAGVNPGDAYLRSGRFRRAFRTEFPFVPGADVAGVVTRVGGDVDGLAVGDRAAAMLPLVQGGGYAAAVNVDAPMVARVPDGVSMRDAAAVPLAGLTALQALRDVAHVAPGHRVAVVGAGGGVGHLAVQVARALGARVTAVASATGLDLVRPLGVDAEVDRAHGWPLRADFDVVFDASGTQPLRRLLRALRRGGTAVTTNPLRANPVSLALANLGSRTAKGVLVTPDGRHLETLLEGLRNGIVRPVVTDTIDLSRASTAHETIEGGHTHGKLVLAVDRARLDDDGTADRRMAPQRPTG